jgi:hypothetical protein
MKPREFMTMLGSTPASSDADVDDSEGKACMLRSARDWKGSAGRRPLPADRHALKRCRRRSDAKPCDGAAPVEAGRDPGQWHPCHGCAVVRNVHPDHLCLSHRPTWPGLRCKPWVSGEQYHWLHPDGVRHPLRKCLIVLRTSSELNHRLGSGDCGG